MKFKKVLLVRLPYYGTFLGDASSLPVGLGYVAESLYNHGIEYNVLDLGLSEHKQKDLFDKIEQYRPDLIGITMMTMHYKFHYEAINEIKKRFADVKIVVGGPHLSTFRNKVLEECKSIDFGVVLEGEETIIELCRGDEHSQIKGIIYRERGGVVYSGDRPLRRDLDNVAFPRYRNFEVSKYLANSIGMQTTRGCPYDCIYCPVQLAIGKQFRARSPESIIEEMIFWYGQGKRNFAIWDDNFTLIQDRVFKICDLIEKNKFKDLWISIPNGIRSDKASYELLKRMHEVGFSMLSFGVEAGNNRILKNLKKGTNIESMERAVKDACSLGYEVYLYFIIGSPGETWKDFQDSLNFAKRHPAAEARFYTLIPFPNTELYEWVKKNNYFIRQPEEYLNTADHFINAPCFATPEMSEKQRRKAFKQGWQLTQKFKMTTKMKSLKKSGIFKKPLAGFLISDFYKKLYKNKWFRNLIVVPLRKIK
ncbi:MAG: radical SAM protein [Candidatus Omnitrophota bacterium]